MTIIFLRFCIDYCLLIFRFKKKALIRLIVRECAKNKWGFPDCANNCECLNGGACDEMTGECLCPPGFKGSQCEVGCGSNK